MSLPPFEAKPTSPEPVKRPRGTWFRATSASSIGIEIAVCIAFGAAAGRYIEREWTHFAPWTTLFGFFVGLAAAVKALIRTARQAKREIAATGIAQAGAESTTSELADAASLAEKADQNRNSRPDPGPR
jgi:hypothetical protein